VEVERFKIEENRRTVNKRMVLQERKMGEEGGKRRRDRDRLEAWVAWMRNKPRSGRNIAY